MCRLECSKGSKGTKAKLKKSSSFNKGFMTVVPAPCDLSDAMREAHRLDEN